jgi:hypothetical protein
MELLSILDTKILMQPAIGYVWNENFMCMVFASLVQYKIDVQSLKHDQLYLLVGGATLATGHHHANSESDTAHE